MKKVFWFFFCIVLPASSMAGEITTLPFALQNPGGARLAPPFSLMDINGNLIRLGDQKGKVVLVHFWATWCASCKEEMPAITALWGKYKDRGFEVLAVAGDSKKAVGRFAREHGLKFPVLIDQYGSVLRSYSVRALPTSYIIGKTGDIKGIATGPRDWTSEEASSLINAFLEEEGEKP